MSRALACLVGALTFASACTGSGSVDSASDLDEVPAELAFVEEAEAEPILRLALAGSGSGDSSGLDSTAFDPAVFDPLLISVNDQSAVVVSDLLYDGLTEVVGRSGELRPGLALSWEANDDFTQWDFVLDLERTNASEVKASFERLVESGGLPRALLGDVLGVQAFVSGDASTVEGFAIVDEQTFRIRLVDPNAGLAWVLSGVGFSVVGEDGGLTGRYVVDDGFGGEHESGAGSVTADDVALASVVLRSNEGSVELVWPSQDGSGRAASVDASALLDAGRVDVAVLGISELDDAVPSSEDKVVLGASRFLVLSGASAETSDVLKREAVVANIDGGALAQVGSLLRMDDGGVVSSALAGFLPGGCVWCEVSADRQRNLAQVVPTVGPLFIGYVGAEQEAMVDRLVVQLSSAGFSVSVGEMAPSELAAGVADGSVDLFFFGWTAVAGSLDGSVGPLFSSAGSSNVFGVSWDEVDELLAKAGLVGDDRERWAMLREAEVKALSQFVAVPLGSQAARVVGVEVVDGLVVRADGSLDLVGVG